MKAKEKKEILEKLAVQHTASMKANITSMKKFGVVFKNKLMEESR